MTPEDLNRWNAVYGAMIAAQVINHNSRGDCSISDKTMLNFMEEAAYIADIQLELKKEIHGFCFPQEGNPDEY